MLNLPQSNNEMQEDSAQSQQFFQFQIRDLGEIHSRSTRNAPLRDPWNVRVDGRQPENNKAADANLLNTASKYNDKAKVIIVAYMRSGSSLLGHM